MILVSKSTPALSKREAAEFRLFIEPKHRTRLPDHEGYARTIGDTLDSQPLDCSRRRLFFKPKTGGIWVRARECGNLKCPFCVVDVLSGNVGRVWYYLRHLPSGADVIYVESRSWSARKIKIRSEDAPPGVLSLPHEKGRALFVPDGELSGAALDEMIRQHTRAVLHEFRAPREFDEDRQRTVWAIPSWLSNEALMAMFEQEGWPLQRMRNGMLQAVGVPAEVVNRVMERIWGPTPKSGVPAGEPPTRKSGVQAQTPTRQQSSTDTTYVGDGVSQEALAYGGEA